MKVVYKYELDPASPSIEMPDGARILKMGTQTGNDIQIWALVDPAFGLVRKQFFILGTGHEYHGDDNLNHFLGTVILANGSLVFHVWEIK